MAAPPPGPSNPPPESHKFNYSGFTHVLFFSGPPSTGNDTFDLQALKNSIKEEKKKRGEKREKKKQEGKKEETNEEKDKRSDEEYGLYYISVPGKPIERRQRSVQRFAKGIIGNQESKHDYSEQIRDVYRQISYNYLIDEEEGTRDYICVFGAGEGVEPAIAVAQILSKVGVIQAWAFEDNFSLVRKLATSKKYTDEQRENFRRVRTQFARVDLFCLLHKLTTQTIDQLGKNIDVCKRCDSTVEDVSHSEVIEVSEPLAEYNSIFPALASQPKPMVGDVAQDTSVGNVVPGSLRKEAETQTESIK